jgi:small subunit ribosomal protein S16
VVLDERKPRDGATLEEIGYYHPIEAEDKQISLKTERAKYWLSVGAQPSDTVHWIMNKQGMTL